MADKLDDEALKGLIANEISTSVIYDQTEISDKRVRAIEYYRGEMNDTPSMPGRSSITSNDFADTVSWMLPGIIRVFSASDRMGVYEPERREDEQFAEQATDYINYVFWRDNPGYRILWDATHDSLVHGKGIVKHYWDNTEDCEYSEHSGLTEEQLALMVNQGDGDVEIVAQKPGEPQMVMGMDPQGQPVAQEIQTFDVKVKRVRTRGRVRIECIPPEDFVIDRDAITLENARFMAHRKEVTRSELIEMGFDKAVVDELPSDRMAFESDEKLVRDESRWMPGQVAEESMTFIELFECYIKVDADGDGIAETVRAYYAGAQGAGELLDWEVWDDDAPFSDIPCEPVPHRWEARSLFDETQDIQRVKTVLTRQMLDNLYASNLPQVEAELDSVENPESLVSPKFGQVIWRKKGSQPTVPHVIPFVADKALNTLQYFDMVKEMRTGVSRSTMALDPETLTNQTATAVQLQKDSAYSQIELIARNQAELGWRRVFKSLLRLIVKHQDRPRTIRLRDEWVEMDPRHWSAGMDVVINVGLGTGSRERDMAMTGQIMNIQKEMIAGLAQFGLMDIAMRMTPKLITAARRFSEAAGIKQPEEFWPEVTDEMVEQVIQQKQQEAANQPDPKMAEAQAKMQIEQAKMRFDMQKEQAKMQSEMELERFRIQADADARKADAELKRMQIAEEMALKREQLGAELALKRELGFAEIEMKRELGQAGVEAKAATSGVHVGGEPG